MSNRKHYTCEWCGWEWFSSPKALKGEEPKVCPVCHVDWRKVNDTLKISELEGGNDKNE